MARRIQIKKFQVLFIFHEECEVLSKMFFLKDLIWLQEKASVVFQAAKYGHSTNTRDDSFLQAWVLIQYDSTVLVTM